MNKQIVLASLLGSAFAAVTTQTKNCGNQVVTDANKALASLSAATAGLKSKADEKAADGLSGCADVAATCKVSEVDTAAWTKAKLALSGYLEQVEVAKVLTDYAKAKKDQADNAKAIIDLTNDVASSGTKIGTDSTADTLKFKVKTAQTAYDIIDGKVTALAGIAAQIEAALTLHNEEQKVLEAPLVSAKATTVLETRDLAVADQAIAELDELIAGKKDASNVVITGKEGSVKDKADAATAVINTSGSHDTTAEVLAVADTTTAMKEWWAFKIVIDKYKDNMDIMDISCGGASMATDYCKSTSLGQVLSTTGTGLNDPTYANYLWYKAKIALSESTNSVKLGTYTTALKAYGDKKALVQWKDQWKVSVDYYNKRNHALKGFDDAVPSVKWTDGAATPAFYKDSANFLTLGANLVPPLRATQVSATTDKSNAVTAEQAAQAKVNAVKGYIELFDKDKVRTGKDLTALKLTLVKPNEDLIRAKYDLQKEEAVKVGKDAELAAKKARRDLKNATPEAADFATLFTEVEASWTRVEARRKFYQVAIDAADKVAKASLKAFNAAKGAVLNNKNAITAATKAVEDALAACKVVKYGEAQAEALRLEEKKASDTKLAGTVKTDYDKKVADSQKAAADTAADATKAVTNVENVICAFPKKETGKDQLPRPLCKEGYCCGAAQRFMKDGTKMAVETCQKLGTHTYTYYPPLPLGATAEPESQTWRWQCISGAKKLAAAATAALAASYMMA